MNQPYCLIILMGLLWLSGYNLFTLTRVESRWSPSTYSGPYQYEPLCLRTRETLLSIPYRTVRASDARWVQGAMLTYNSHIMRVELGWRQMGFGQSMLSCKEKDLCFCARMLGVLSFSEGLSGLTATTSVPFWVFLFAAQIWITAYTKKTGKASQLHGDS